MILGQFGPARRPLAEDCVIVSIEQLQREMGKAALLNAIRQARPVPVRLPGGFTVEVPITYEAHPLVNPPGKWADLDHDTVRTRFSCPRCFRPARKLFACPLSGSGRLSEPGCRICHQVTYVSANCGGSRFYREVVRRQRQLGRLRRKLSALRLPRFTRQALEAGVEVLGSELRGAWKRYGRRTPVRHGRGIRRPYKQGSRAL